MTALAALARYYDRLAEQGEVPPFGYSLQNIGWCLLIGPDGTPLQCISLMEGEGRKMRPRSLAVPQPVKRTSGIASNFLWDKTSYVLGVTAGEGRRTTQEHEAFKTLHREALAGTRDPGLAALLAFLDRWSPDQFVAPLFPEEMRDANLVFRFAEERGYLHDRPAAKALWARLAAANGAAEAICLVSGEAAPIARLHPAIKGVWGAQSSGASIVSFNLDAFASYGHEQGENAPVGEPAAFAYTTALNRLLAPGSRNRVQIGDASTVFWAEAEDREQALRAEDLFAAALGRPIDEKMEANKIRPVLDAIAKGRPLDKIDPQLAHGVRFYVLGLSPNAARLSVRFWFEDSFGVFLDRLGRHALDLALEPPPRDERPTVSRLLIETAVLRKRENVPSQLAGDFLRAILSGGRYPATLLSTLLMRLRADGSVTALRVAMLKAIVARNRRLDAQDKSRPAKEEPPVSLNLDCNDPGYLLGRLFAVYEQAQYAALGNINASIRDKFFGAASSTPQTVAGVLQRGLIPHLAKVRKERPGQAINIEKEIAAIMERFDPTKNPFPRALPPEQQALFALGYYHQRSRQFAGKPKSADPEANVDANNEEEAA